MHAHNQITAVFGSFCGLGMRGGIPMDGAHEPLDQIRKGFRVGCFLAAGIKLLDAVKVEFRSLERSHRPAREGALFRGRNQKQLAIRMTRVVKDGGILFQDLSIRSFQNLHEHSGAMHQDASEANIGVLFSRDFENIDKSVLTLMLWEKARAEIGKSDHWIGLLSG